MTIQSLALNMVVRNEAHRIRQTLEAVLPLVDEAIIVDQESTDGTPDICADMGVTVYRDQHHGYCEPSRQLAMDKTTSAWILVMDADESPTAEFTDELRSLDKHLQVRLRIGAKVGGEVQDIGRPVFRLIQRDRFYHKAEIHSCPLPNEVLTPSMGLFVLPYIALWDTKTWAEYLDGLANYETLLHVHPKMAIHAEHNHTFLHLANSLGLTGADLDAMPAEKRRALGFHWDKEKEAAHA
jgi:glycosyltransferase involved in cell wall biosynthesis